MFKVMNKSRRAVALSFCICIIIGMIFWVFRFITVNKKAFRQDEVVYNMGECVNLDGNFFFTNQENTKGYSITVNSMDLKNIEDINKEYNLNNSFLYTSKYVFFLNLTIINESNTDGVISALGLALHNGSLYMPVDFELWNCIDHNINGNVAIKLRENSQVDIVIPFSPQQLDVETNSRKLYKKMENEDFFLVVSDFPSRIKIKVR